MCLLIFICLFFLLCLFLFALLFPVYSLLFHVKNDPFFHLFVWFCFVSCFKSPAILHSCCQCYGDLVNLISHLRHFFFFFDHMYFFFIDKIASFFSTFTSVSVQALFYILYSSKLLILELFLIQ